MIQERIAAQLTIRLLALAASDSTGLLAFKRLPCLFGLEVFRVCSACFDAATWHAFGPLGSSAMPAAAASDCLGAWDVTAWAPAVASSGLWVLRRVACQDPPFAGDGARAFLPLRFPQGLQEFEDSQCLTACTLHLAARCTCLHLDMQDGCTA